MGAAPPAPPTTVVAFFDVTALAPLARLDGPVSFPVDSAPPLRPVPGDVPARVWPEIRQVPGAVGAVAPDVALRLSPEPSDLPSPVDDTDTVLGVTPVAVVTPVASTVAPETPAVPIVPSWTTERFLPLRGSGQATGAPGHHPLVGTAAHRATGVHR